MGVSVPSLVEVQNPANPKFSSVLAHVCRSYECVLQGLTEALELIRVCKRSESANVTIALASIECGLGVALLRSPEGNFYVDYKE